jgi:hypothetical protein
MKNWQVVSVAADSVVVTGVGYGASQLWEAGSEGLRELSRLGTDSGHLVVDRKSGAQITMRLSGRDLLLTIIDSAGRDVPLPERASGPLELSPDGHFAFFVGAAEENGSSSGASPQQGPLTLLDLRTGDATPLGPVTLDGDDIVGADVDGGPSWVDDDTFMVSQRDVGDAKQRVWACEAPSATCAAATGWVPEDGPLVIPSIGVLW